MKKTLAEIKYDQLVAAYDRLIADHRTLEGQYDALLEDFRALATHEMRQFIHQAAIHRPRKKRARKCYDERVVTK